MRAVQITELTGPDTALQVVDLPEPEPSHMLTPGSGVIVDVHARHREKVDAAGSVDAQVDRLCELNVIEQVANVCQTTIVRDAWDRGQPLAVHGWVYGLKDGLLRDLGTTVLGPDEAQSMYQAALGAL